MSDKAPKFDTITGEDWKRSLAAARATPNAVSEQIRQRISMQNKRPLTEAEKQFVKEAEETSFVVEYHESGYPIATGADHNSQCFSGNVEEKRDGEGGATYWLKD